MPCFQINTISVKFIAKNKDNLIKALKNGGFTYTENGDIITVMGHGGNFSIDLKNERIDMQERRSNYEAMNILKRHYSEETINDIAVKMKWSKSKNKNKINLTRY